jgi:hypothetical protein
MGFDESPGFCLNKLYADGAGATFLGREIVLPLALRGVLSAAWETGHSVNAKKAVRINTSAESLLIFWMRLSHDNILALI